MYFWQLMADLGEYDDFDYIVRANIAEDIRSKATSISCLECSHRYALQLALCYRIGFGTGQDFEAGRKWLAKAAATEAEAQSAIKRLTQEYKLTGRLTEQVRNALGISVLVTTDRTQQYQVQGRILMAEQSLSSEIKARESELGLLHFCLSKLKSDLAQIYKAQGRLGEAKKLQQEMITICTTKNGESHPSVLAAKAALAAILADEGLLVEAEKSQRELQPIFEQVLGDEHPETVIALQNWGATLHSQNRHQEAADIFRRVRTTRVKTLTEDHPLTIRADICLASILHGQGLLKEMDELMAHISKSSARSGDPVIEAHIQMNLATFYMDQDRLQEAEEAAHRAVRILSKTLGKDDPMRLNAEEVLAVVYGEKREFAKEEELLRAILQTKASLDKRSPSVSNTRAYLASNLLKQGRVQDSAAEAAAVLDNLKDSLSLDPGNFLSCTEILASIMSRKGQLEGAESLRHELLLSYERVLGDSHPFTMQARSNLAGFYAEKGRFDKAAELQGHVLKTLEDTSQFGKFAIQTARELALTFREQNKFVEAVQLCQKALLWCEKAVGSDHIDSVAVYNILAGTYLQWGRLTEAEAIYESKVLPHVAETDLEMYVYETMAELRRAQGRPAESMALSQKALRLTLQRLGAEHPVSIKMVGNVLGSRLSREPLTVELEQEALENLRSKKEILGSQHFSTLKTLSDLAYAYGEHGRLQEAEALYNSIEADDQQEGNLQNAQRYATFLAKRADLLLRSEQFERAQALQEQALAIRQRLLPPEHSAVLVSIANLASTLSARGMYEEAELRLRHVIRLREAHLPSDAGPTLAAKKDLAAVLYFKGELANSEALYVAVVEASQRMGVSPAVLQGLMAELRQVEEALNEAHMNQAEAST